MSSVIELLPQIAGAFGALIAVFTALKLLTSGVEYYFSARRKYKDWRHKRTLILFATTEEIAKYSVKMPDSRRPTVAELLQDIARSYRISNERLTRTRVRMVQLMFLFLFGIITVWLLRDALIPRVPGP